MHLFKRKRRVELRGGDVGNVDSQPTVWGAIQFALEWIACHRPPPRAKYVCLSFARRRLQGIPVVTLAWLIATKEKTLPIPGSCPSQFVRLLERCWIQDHRKRPSFGEIVISLREAPAQFLATDRRSFASIKVRCVAQPN